MPEEHSITTSLLNRLKDCKKDLGISYGAVADKCGIPKDVFYHFTNGERPLNEERSGKLNLFLNNLGY
jgi:hypothetical protein